MNQHDTTPESSSDLAGDKPIHTPQEDLLGYGPFTEHLARGILRIPSPEGFVVSLSGAWGSGKTSMLQLIEYHLKCGLTEDKIGVMHFNPWWFSGSDDLIRRFFDQLQLTFSSVFKLRVSDLRQKVAAFASVVSETPIPYHEIAKATEKVVTPRPKDIERIKSEISELLHKQKQRVLIVIDDIDRLTAEEIRQLFRVVKAVADFPNVIYLLAFDREVVVNALDSMQNTPGEEYLEKVVQLPLDLPTPDTTGLQDMLFKRLNSILTGTNDIFFDNSRWVNLYVMSIDHFFETPRDVIRFCNALAFNYAAVINEVNAIDFIIIELLRVFCPKAYYFISENEDIFAGPIQTGAYYHTTSASDKSRFEAVLNELPAHLQEPVSKLIRRVFPKVGSLYKDQLHDSTVPVQWRKERRVCSPEVFRTYFRLSVPPSDISNRETQALIELIANPKAFGQRLLDYAEQFTPKGTTRLRAILDQLRDYADGDIPAVQIPAMLKAIFAVADRLVNVKETRQGLFDRDIDIRLGSLTYQLLKQLGSGKCYAPLRDAIQEGESLYFAEHIVIVLGQEQGKHSSQADATVTWLVTTEQLEVLEKLVLEKIRMAASTGDLLQAPHLTNLLYFWKDFGDSDEPRTWVESLANEPSNLVALLEQFGGYKYAQTIGEAYVKPEYYLNPDGLKPFIDPTEMSKILKGVISDTLPPSQKIVLETFRREMADYELRHTQEEGS